MLKNIIKIQKEGNNVKNMLRIFLALRFVPPNGGGMED